MRRSLALALVVVALPACGKPPYHDVAGPFTGTTYRFVVDQLVLPLERTDSGDDLNGDGRVDNQLANICGTLAGDNDLTGAVDDMLGSGVLAPVVEITTDDPSLRNDPTVGVRFIGQDGEAADEMGGTLVAGVLTTNPTRLTQAPASATLHLPLYEHASPLTLPAIGLELRLAADADGFGGALSGAFPTGSDLMPAWAGLVQMMTANPQEFPYLIEIFDPNQDGVVTFDEFARNGLIRNLLSPDVQLTDGQGRWAPAKDNAVKDSLSFGLWIHLRPCATGRCHAPVESCQDRVRDGAETDVDCGGGCLGCPGGATCAVAADCQSGQCAGGVCLPPSCSDGVQDGYELGVDCSFGCGPCADGTACRGDADCATGYCADQLSVGVCRQTACTDGARDNDEVDVDCGGHCPRCRRGQLCHSDGDCASNKCANVSCPDPFSCTGTCA